VRVQVRKRAPGQRSRVAGAELVVRELYRLQYTKAGLEGTVKEGFRKREDFFRKTVKGLGGTTESANWAYGDEDVFSRARRWIKPRGRAD
jgi:hypothetical protein